MRNNRRFYALGRYDYVLGPSGTGVSSHIVWDVCAGDEIILAGFMRQDAAEAWAEHYNTHPDEAPL